MQQMSAQKKVRSVPGTLSTRDRLKAAARGLFADRGIEGATVRDILTAAGEKNGASLNYYFGSKDELIRELTVDVFKLMNDRWSERAAILERSEQPASLRDYVRLLVEASDTRDVEDEPTTARLSEAITHHRNHLVREVMKANNFTAYDRILAKIAEGLSHLPQPVLRQRLLLFTRYLSSVFALYESARIQASQIRTVRLPENADLGILTDTAVGLLTAEIVDGKST